MKYAVSLDFLMLMKENWKMSTRVVIEVTSMLSFGARTNLKNGKNSMAMIQKICCTSL